MQVIYFGKWSVSRVVSDMSCGRFRNDWWLVNSEASGVWRAVVRSKGSGSSDGPVYERS